jgi:hypothetical protein
MIIHFQRIIKEMYAVRPLLMILIKLLMLIISITSLERAVGQTISKCSAMSFNSTIKGVEILQKKKYKTMTIGTYNDEVYCLKSATQHDGDDCNENSAYIVLRTYIKVYKIQDIQTLKALQVSFAEDYQNVSQIHTIDPAILTAPDTEEISEPLLSLKQDGGTDIYMSLDEFMRITIAKIVIVNPVDRILRDGPHLVPTLLNGPILRIPAFSNISYFAAWLGHWPNKEGLRFGTVNKNNYSVTDTHWCVTDIWNGRGYNQQEARIMLLPDGESIFVIFTARFFGNPLKPFSQMYAILRRNASCNEYNIPSRPIWVDYKRNLHNKNFVPFIYNSSIHLIPSFNPMVVIRLEGDHQVGSDHVDGLAPVTHIIDHANNCTSESEIPYSLPWKEEYGTHIRGGTAALPVPGKDYYLLFFHTRKNGPAVGVGHYFPGILFYCLAALLYS